MWPWEHVALGYLLYSLVCRATRYHRPTGDGTLVVLVAAVLPDLVDKPLSWGFDVFPTGYAAGHSVFVAVPAAVLAVTVASRAGKPEVGGAFLVGHWSHLVGDVLDPLRSGDPVAITRVLWPLVDQPGYERELGLARGFVYLEGFLGDLWTANLTSVEALYLLLAPLALAVWIADGVPGTGRIRRGLLALRRISDEVRRA